MALHHILPILSAGKLSPMAAMPFLATVVPEDSPIILSGVLLTLVVIYLASKIGAEAAKWFDFPPVLGELVAGVVVGVSALHLVIFPEGTRSAPGDRLPYQPGVAALVMGSSAPCYPVATNSGRHWGRRAFHKTPGVISISILPALPTGLARKPLMEALESQIEAETARLMAQA